MEYSYPLRHDWSTEEIMQVMDFFSAVEKAYESNIEREEFMNAYRGFKKVVPSMAEEKTICREFEEASGFSSYHVVKKAKESETGDQISM